MAAAWQLQLTWEALRLGFEPEGVFRKHMIVKGRNRDTAWFAMLNDDWPRIKGNMERCLDGDQPGLSLAELNRSPRLGT